MPKPRRSNSRKRSKAAAPPREQNETGALPDQHIHGESKDTPLLIDQSSRQQPTLNQSDSEWSHRSWYKTVQGWKVALELPKAILEVIAIPFAIGYAIVTGLLWWDQRQNFQRDERAWVGIKDITLASEIKNPLTIAVNVINSGKTPALGVHLADISAGNTETAAMVSGASHENGAVTPGTNTVFYVDLAPSDGMIKLLKAHEAKIYVRGTIEYLDIFGDTHPTTFCAYYPPPANVPNFFNCTDGGSNMK